VHLFKRIPGQRFKLIGDRITRSSLRSYVLPIILRIPLDNKTHSALIQKIINRILVPCSDLLNAYSKRRLATRSVWK